MKEAVSTSETSVSFYETARRSIAEGWHLQASTGAQSLIRNSENRKAPKTESFFMEVDSNLNTTVTMTTMTTGSSSKV
jgi:hypothetical protein